MRGGGAEERSHASRGEVPAARPRGAAVGEGWDGRDARRRCSSLFRLQSGRGPRGHRVGPAAPPRPACGGRASPFSALPLGSAALGAAPCWAAQPSLSTAVCPEQRRLVCCSGAPSASPRATVEAAPLAHCGGAQRPPARGAALPVCAHWRPSRTVEQTAPLVHGLHRKGAPLCSAALGCAAVRCFGRRRLRCSVPPIKVGSGRRPRAAPPCAASVCAARAHPRRRAAS